MEILVAILVIALLAAVAFAVIQRRPGGVAALTRSRSAPAGQRVRRAPHDDAMTAAVVEHAQVTDPAQVPAAEARLKAEARNVAAGLQADALRTEHQRAGDQLDDGVYADDPRVDGSVEPGPADPPIDGRPRRPG